MTGDGTGVPFGFAAYEPERRRRRRAWPWILTLVIVAALVAGAAVGAEALARGAVQGGVRQLVVAQVDLPADQPVDVEVPGLVIPQLLSGRLDAVDVSSPDVAVGPLTGDVAVRLTDVPIGADAAAGPGTAQVRLDADQLRVLLGTIDDFPADTVALAAPDVTISRALSVLGVSIPVGVSLQPGAADGRLVLTPSAFRIGDAQVSADDLRSRFGGVADAVLREWNVCIAADIPAALTLTGASVVGDQVVADFAIDGAVVVDPALRANGACG
ncbi:LmeA family phospholipid-binding protein [Microbacterium sp. NPDC091313]